MSFRFIFLSFSVPVAACGVVLAAAGSQHSTLAWTLFVLTAGMRLTLHCLPMQRRSTLLADTWLVPLRDVLLCWVWCRSFSTSRVLWRGQEFDVDADGQMRRLG